MAKLIYMGEDSKWLSKMIDLCREDHDDLVRHDDVADMSQLR